ncbi:spore germination protein GerPC [Thermoflavimicrobium dichotomicum]|uniref:Spore germination protein GerPC n=1 Tax=Thermoflavimicrobium dichotomicum TaxID=46223 RepID=A0A1I3JBL6_9BACL|nr:spore germination protein GerPC [Thermoflavimicrobium dichotomicum]SFI57644.1 Spore germination protein GerPC [Thermoflavimicrobium dichotomicum]
MLEQLWHRLNRLEKKISLLKKENQELKEKIEQIQPLKIEKIEYKINELKVETLSGTLNVGLTAVADKKSMKKLMDQMIEKQQDQSENEISHGQMNDDQKTSPDDQDSLY